MVEAAEAPAPQEAGDASRGPDAPERETGEVAALRAALLPANLKVAYAASWSAGLHITDGAASYLYDAEGEGYLDCVNNVAHVGHCHPKVVAAVTSQLTKLNTNTRYLSSGLVDYAQRLTALLPEELQVVFMVTSGSEANDLALRLIRASSKPSAQHIAVLSSAYHGHSLATLGLSPYKFQGRGGFPCPPHIHIIPCPDTFRGLHLDGKAAARTVIQAAAAKGGEIAAFFYESFPSCAGQVVLPEGYLGDVCASMRAVGAVCVADEVQTGFGRMGCSFWGFEAAGDTRPEIVTLGKGIGNGFPMGAVVTTQRIAQAFANGMEYFNTGGGCNAACAAGLAVLDVLAEEGLQAKAADVGAFLLKGLRKLGGHAPCVGDVRGCGLFLGIEVVIDKGSKEPAPHVADWIVAACMRCHSVLLSTDGPDNNVIKIKPPLSFGREDAQMLLDVLRAVLLEELPPRLPELLGLDRAVLDARASAHSVLQKLQLGDAAPATAPRVLPPSAPPEMPPPGEATRSSSGSAPAPCQADSSEVEPAAGWWSAKLSTSLPLPLPLTTEFAVGLALGIGIGAVAVLLCPGGRWVSRG
mmetsp:Transcript_42577/g.107631  ORF Transcript_42577/g.107631 Transcript_42577/m.107631 type:complete len:582 (-) Transcript_42577:869-2614(-)